MEFYRKDVMIPVDVYEDDTLEMVYYKLSIQLKCSIDDIYLFSSRHYDTFTSNQIFERLYMPEYNGVPAFQLRNFYEGVNEHVREVKGNQVYQVEDLEDLHGVLIEFPIGQRVKSAADPSNASELDRYSNTETDMSTFQRLLLDYMPFQKIHVCCKEDFSEKMYLQYFEHEKLDAVAMKRKHDSLAKLYPLSLKYTPQVEGITHVSCRIDPLRPMAIPLDIIFNFLHVSDEIPMIQYNSGNEDNIMYKLLSKQVDIKGDKIPVLNYRTVLKHDNSYKRSVTVFMNETKDTITFAFMGDGSIIMDIYCSPYSVEEVDSAFLKYKDCLVKVHDLMYKSGFVYPNFTTIRKSVILKMDVISRFQIKDTLPRTCANPFFIGMGDDMRYRRVSRFNESALIDELCIEYSDRGKSEQLAPLISQIMGVSPQEARSIAEDRISAHEVLREKNPNKRFVVKNRVGFVSIVKHKNEDIVMTIMGITSIFYLESIQRNTRAYVAFQMNQSIQCEQEKIKIEPIKQINYRYVEDSDSDNGFEFDESESDDGFEFDEMEGGADKNLDLIIRNESFLITRIKNTFNPSPNYAKQCPLPRRPVVLKPEEVIPENLKSFNTRTHNKHTFVCSKYWDMKRKMPLDKVDDPSQLIKPHEIHGREVDFKKDGTIIEIQDPDKFHPYPGIMHKDGLDAPCCFIKPQDKVRPEKIIAEAKQYIVQGLSLNKPGQVGRLPKSIRYFFGLTEKDTHLLRYGIEKPHTFVKCIDAVFQKAFVLKKNQTVTDQIIMWTKRGFNTYNNGNLKRQFKTVDKFVQHLPDMDYTYLWEIVQDMLNVNLVIFRDPENDGDDLEVICPSNHYSTRTFDRKKQILMILEHKLEKGVAFEPLVEHNAKKNTQTILHSFTNKYLHEGFEGLVQIFWKCTNTHSSNTPNIIASVMYERLERGKQIVKENTCIGFSINDYFVPCYPSAVLPDVPQTNEIPVHEYEGTLKRLQKLSKEIPCNPKFKVVENEQIIGLILETNSFVPCHPEPDHSTELPVYLSTIQYEYDPIPHTQDDERIRNVRRIKADKCLFAACRRLLKSIVHNDVSAQHKLDKHVQQKSVTDKEIKQLLNSKIQWIDKIDESFILEQVKCGGCCFAADKLILPKYNLVDGQPNNYFVRLADELNHYARISTFITSSQLSIPDIQFSVVENEVLLTTSTVKKYYASLMESKRLPTFYTTFDNANPKHVPANLSVIKVQKVGMITL